MPEDTLAPFVVTVAMTRRLRAALAQIWWLAAVGVLATALGALVWLWPEAKLAQTAAAPGGGRRWPSEGARYHELPVGSIGRHANGFWGALTLIATEAALFSYLLFSYYYVAIQHGRDWLPDKLPEFKLSAPDTVLLIASSFVVARGEKLIRNRRPAARRFGCSAARSWARCSSACRSGNGARRTSRSSPAPTARSITRVTGFHLVHVVVGVLVLLALACWSARGLFRREAQRGRNLRRALLALRRCRVAVPVHNLLHHSLSRRRVRHGGAFLRMAARAPHQIPAMVDAGAHLRLAGARAHFGCWRCLSASAWRAMPAIPPPRRSRIGFGAARLRVEDLQRRLLRGQPRRARGGRDRLARNEAGRNGRAFRRGRSALRRRGRARLCLDARRARALVCAFRQWNRDMAHFALRTGVSGFAVLFAFSAAAAPALRVCADPNNMPFSRADGAGFENKLAEMIGARLGRPVVYAWRAQRRGFLRHGLSAGECDLVAGVPSGSQAVRASKPYYRSSYVFVTRPGEPPVSSFDDPVLKRLRIGVQLIGDDGMNTPPAHELAQRGIVDNVRGYSVYGNYAEPAPPAEILDALRRHEIDVAAAWGPLAGYFAAQSTPPLVVTPIDAKGAHLPLSFDISVGVRKRDAELAAQVQDALDADGPAIARSARRLSCPGRTMQTGEAQAANRTKRGMAIVTGRKRKPWSVAAIFGAVAALGVVLASCRARFPRRRMRPKFRRAKRRAGSGRWAGSRLPMQGSRSWS